MMYCYRCYLPLGPEFIFKKRIKSSTQIISCTTNYAIFCNLNQQPISYGSGGNAKLLNGKSKPQPTNSNSYTSSTTAKKYPYTETKFYKKIATLFQIFCSTKKIGVTSYQVLSSKNPKKLGTKLLKKEQLS